MRIAVIGAGVAGSYLIPTLSEEHKVTGFEMQKKDEFTAVCAWLTCKHEMKKLINPLGLSFEDYILYEGKEMLIKVGNGFASIKVDGLVTYDKSLIEKDLVKGYDVKFGTIVKSMDSLKGFDLIIDSTGFHRPLLGKPSSNFFVPTVEYKVRYSNPPFNDFVIIPFSNLSGYLWYFPLGDGYVHVGAGDYYRRHNRFLADFLKKHKPDRFLKKMGRPIRMSPPSMSTPIVNGKVVGVGESIGTVYPVVGEGIIPSLQCAKLLADNMYNIRSYVSKVTRKFAIYKTFFNLIYNKIKGRLGFLDMVRVMYVFAHMRMNEDRYGMKVDPSFVSSVMKVLKSF